MKQIVLRALVGITGLILVLILAWIALTLSNLPDVSVLQRYRPAAATEVFDRNGNRLAGFSGSQFRIWVPLQSLPEVVVKAVVIAEDDTFFEHGGVNLQATWEALLHDVKEKRFARGGSTITQQMIKNVLLTREKTLSRKLREFVLARRAERLLTKHRILEIYLNEVEWGENIYGIEAASRYYFDKHATDLTPAEAALLAGMLPNPRSYNPFRRPERALARRDRVLFNMRQARVLTDEEYRRATTEELRLRPAAGARFDFTLLVGTGQRPCFHRVLEAVLLGFYGDYGLYREGLTVRTTIDGGLQNELDTWLDDARGQEGLPGEVTAVYEESEIRAVVCSTNEAGIWFRLESLGFPAGGYELRILPPSAISPDELVVQTGTSLPPAAGTNSPGRPFRSRAPKQRT